jgi:glycosyltransferase involved in cell wall biosynthesis
MTQWVQQEMLPPIIHSTVLPTEMEQPPAPAPEVHPEDEWFAPVANAGAPLVEVVASCLSLGGAERVAVATACGLTGHGWQVRLINAGAHHDVRGELVQQLESAGVGYTEAEKPNLSGVATIWWGTVLDGYDHIPGSIWVAHSPGDHVLSQLASVADLVDRVVSVSRETAQRVNETTGLPATVIPNGVGSEFWCHSVKQREESDPFVIGWLGRYAPEKGLERAIKAMQHLPGHVRLRCYGGGHLRLKLLELAREHGVHERVDVGGVVDAKSAYREFDALLLCSDFEGHPLVAVEAAAMGVPVVYVETLGDLRSQLPDGDRGVATKANEYSIAAAITGLVEHPTRARGIATRAADWTAENLSREKQVQAYDREVRLVSEGIHWADDGRPKVLAAIDRPGWAFDRIAQQLVRQLPAFDWQICPYMDVPDCGADLTIAFWWKSAWRLRPRTRRLITCLYDAMSWWKSDESESLARALGMADVVAVANQAMAEDVARWHPAKLCVVEDGVDTEMFQPLEMPEEHTMGWCGNSSTSKLFGIHDLKGVEVIETAARWAGLPLVKADAAERLTPHRLMSREFYSRISAYCCGSLSEGTPNPSLEALACGRPVVTTHVGVLARVEHPAVIHTERHPAAMAEAMKQATPELSIAARELALEYSWTKKVDAWTDCLTTALT